MLILQCCLKLLRKLQENSRGLLLMLHHVSLGQNETKVSGWYSHYLKNWAIYEE